MDIALLKTFLEVHKTRNFSVAAGNLYLTAAAVSARIKQLEQFLGVKLFIRQRGNLLLTGEGERLLPHAETMLLNWSRTIQEVALHSDQSQRLHIGATSGLWQYGLFDVLMKISSSIPSLALRAEAHDVNELVRMMIDRTLDISVLYEPPILPELKSVKIGQLKLVMASSIIGITAASAFSSDYVYVDWGTSFAMFHADKFGEVVPTVLSVNLASIAHRYIQENPGTAYLPSILVGDDVVNQVKNTPTFRKPVYICYRANHEQLELIQNIIDLVDDIRI